MPITIRLQGQDGAEPSKKWEFNDDVQKIVIGRDSTRCQVVFPEDDVRVGREHCALVRRLGRYRLEFNRDHSVWIDGRDAFPGEQIPPRCNLRIGHEGPTLFFETPSSTNLKETFKTLKNTLKATMGKVAQFGLTQRLEGLVREARRSRNAALAAVSGLLALACIVAGIGYFLWVRLHSYSQQVIDVNNRVNELTPQQREELSVGAGKVRGAMMLISTPADPKVLAVGFLIDTSKRLVATNADVADIWSRVPVLYATPSGRQEKYVVDEVFYHPAVIRISPLGPRRRAETPGDGDADQFSPAVAVLHLKKDDQNGFPSGVTQVSLATRDEIQKLQARPVPVGMSGYSGAATDSAANGKPIPADLSGTVNQVTDFGNDPNSEWPNNQLVGYTVLGNAVATGSGFSGSPIYLESGAVVAINQSHEKPESANTLAYGIRIDCLYELLQHHGPDKLMAPPQGWEQGQMKTHVDQVEQFDQSPWEAIQTLQTAHLLQLWDEPTSTERDSQKKEQDFQKNLMTCNQAVDKLEKAKNAFPFVYLARGRLYAKRSFDEDVPDEKRKEYLEKAIADFNKANLNQDCLEAKLWLQRIEYLRMTMDHPADQGDNSALDRYSDVFKNVDQIMNEPSAKRSPALQALGWQIKAQCYWTSPSDEADTFLDNAIKAFPQWSETYRRRAAYWEGRRAFEQKKQEAGQGDQEAITKAQVNKKQYQDTEDRIKQGITKARAAVEKARIWSKRQNTGDRSEIDGAVSDAVDACRLTQSQGWICLDCYGHVLAFGAEYKDAISKALDAFGVSPDATAAFHSKGDVYEFRHNRPNSQ